MSTEEFRNVELYRPRTGRLLTETSQIVNEADYLRNISEGLTVFNETLTVQRESVFNLSSIFPLSMFRDITTGTVTPDQDQYIVEPNSSLESAQRGVYVPGHSSNIGIGIRSEADSEFRWGYYDDRDGIYYQRTIANGLQLGYRRRTDDELIDRVDFNVDKLDGTGPSGINIDIDKGYVFEIDFTWYGYGPIVWKVLPRKLSSGTVEKVAVIHVEFVEGNTSISNTSLPIKVENIGTTGNVFVTGRQYSILGPYKTESRNTGYTNPSVTVTDEWTPLISFRRLTTDSIYTLRTEGIDIINKGAENIEYQLILNATLTGASPVSPENRSVGETAVEFDISATAFADGESFYSGLAPAGGNGRTAANKTDTEIDKEVPRSYWVTLVARTLDAAATTDVVAHIDALEEW